MTAYYYVQLETSEGVVLKLSPSDNYSESVGYAEDILALGGLCAVMYHSTLDIEDFEVYPLTERE